MGVSAVVADGKVANMESAVSKEQKSSATNVDKDQFMTLLVAQMKYQDPMQPTSNTEYISQYATFSELEQMQNMSKSLELSRASELAGKTVVISPTEDNMLTKDLEGQVDRVFYISNKAFVEVDGKTFSASDVSQIMSSDYSEAKRLVQAWGEEVDKLPNINEITSDHANAVYNLYNMYDAFSDSTKSMVEPSYVTTINQYKGLIDDILASQAQNEANADKEQESAGDDGTASEEDNTKEGMA